MSLTCQIVERKHFHLLQSHTAHIRSPSVPNGWDLALGRDVLHQYQLNNIIELDVFQPIRHSQRAVLSERTSTSILKFTCWNKARLQNGWLVFVSLSSIHQPKKKTFD